MGAWILRTWACLNAECANQFESGESAPYCPLCDCAKVRWVPGGGNIISPSTKHADRTLRGVAQSFGLTNLNSAREGEAAAPSLPTPKQIPGAPPLVLPGGIQVPRTFTPSSQFVGQQNPVKVTTALDGKKFAKGNGGRVPTSIRPGHIDPRKLAL